MAGSAAYNNNNNIINHHNLEEDVGVLGCNEECPNLIQSSSSSSSSKFLLTHHGVGINVKRTPQSLIEDLNPVPPANINNNNNNSSNNNNNSDLFYTYSVPREISMPNTSLDFNIGLTSHDQMDGLWLLGGNTKTTHDCPCPSNDGEDCLQFGVDYPPNENIEEQSP